MAARKKKAKGGAARKASPKSNVVVASKVKEAVRGAGVRMAGDFGDALNARVHEMIAGAVSRAKMNNRGTVRPQDL